MTKRILTRAKFKAWLESKRPRAIVGEKKTCYFCPLAKYLETEFGASVSVGLRTFSVTKAGKQSIPLPRWGMRFVVSVDNGSEERITAALALKILEGCK